MTERSSPDSAALADRFATGIIGLHVEGETPTIMIAVSVPERDMIVRALRALAQAAGGPPITDLIFLKQQSERLSVEDQHALAEFIAPNLGMVLVAEPPHPDDPHRDVPQAAPTKSAPAGKASHNSGERDPSVMPDYTGADTTEPQAAPEPWAYYVEHTKFGVELSLDRPNEDSVQRGWIATPLYPTTSLSRPQQD